MPCPVCGAPRATSANGQRTLMYCSQGCSKKSARQDGSARGRARGSIPRPGTCAMCGKPISLSQTSAPQGKSKCRDCVTAVKSSRVRFEPQSKSCKVCSRTFIAIRSNQVNCSTKCRNRARYRRGSGPGRSPGTTTRGYGSEHQRLRKKLLPFAYGTACHLCGHVMSLGQVLHLDHTEDRTGYRGFAHARCNVREGSLRGGQSTRQRALARGQAVRDAA